MEKADIFEIARLNGKSSEYYLKIAGSDGTAWQGGNQNWWQDKAAENAGGNRTRRMRADKYYRLWQIGCGVIAMSDAELYLTIQNRGCSLSVPVMFDKNMRQTGICNRDAYRNYIEQMYDTKYTIAGNMLNLTTGLYPWVMEKGLHHFLKAGSCSRTKVKWSRYGSFFGVVKKQKVLNEIERMLRDDMPVVFAYYSFMGVKMNLYASMRAAVEKNAAEADSVNSHYMTVIGLYGCPAGNAGSRRYILKVVSWGKIYYIDYDEYAKKLNYFSNILSVY